MRRFEVQKIEWTAKTKTIFTVKSDKQPKIFAELNGSRDTSERHKIELFYHRPKMFAEEQRYQVHSM